MLEVIDRSETLSDWRRPDGGLPGLGAEGGRLLGYFPDEDLACGTAEAASGGYFDINNVPPWDTWVLLTEQPDQPRKSRGTCLIAWVPPAFISRAQLGIEANPAAKLGSARFGVLSMLSRARR